MAASIARVACSPSQYTSYLLPPRIGAPPSMRESSAAKPGSRTPPGSARASRPTFSGLSSRGSFRPGSGRRNDFSERGLALAGGGSERTGSADTRRDCSSRIAAARRGDRGSEGHGLAVCRQLGEGPAELGLEGAGEGGAGGVFAVVEEDAARRRRQRAAPAEELVAVGVGGEHLEAAHFGAHWHRLAVDAQHLGAVEEGAAAGAGGLEADDEHH